MLMRCTAELPDDDKLSDTEIQRGADESLKSIGALNEACMEESKTTEHAQFQTQRIRHDPESPTVINVLDPEPDDDTLPMVTKNMRFGSDVRMTAADKNDSGMSSIGPGGKKKRRLGRWTEKEHERFLEALRIYGKDWTMI